MFKRSFNSYFLAYYFYYSNITGRTQPGKKRKRPFKFTFIMPKKIYIFDNKSRSCKQAYGFYEFFEPYSFVYSTCPAAPGERNRKVE